MNKFIIKYLTIFVVLISIMFFTLVSVNKVLSEKEHEAMFQQRPQMGMDMPMPPPDKKGPPLSIPLIAIVLVSSTFTYIILRYIDKNYVSPLINIETNVQRIRRGNLDVTFEAVSEDYTVQETFNALNDMITGLKEKDKLQDEFIRNLVHDLRAPIAAQERAMEILEEEMKDNELVKGMVENNDAYLKLINNIIDVFSQKEIKIDKIEFKLSKLIDNITSALGPIIREKNITIKKEVDDNFIIWSDYTSLHRIIMNLVYNALENIGNDKTISIKAIKNSASDTIMIRDNGKGMSDTQIKTVFSKHIVRGNKENKLISGIGLSVVRDLVTKNQGKINVESVENSYTKFTIVLPRKSVKENNGKNRYYNS
ncbi:MAG: HAMP domain-containing histidine kinase [Candidatus Gastranaerophilales bacterium]|nr:HAMP domain-containing histidine kinase [Candidatus Gastranaerophilales bacterium]